MMPNDLPPWYTVYRQTQCWLKAGVFEDLVRDLGMLLREIAGWPPQSRAAILDGRTLQSSPESGTRAGYDGHKRRKGSKVYLAVDTMSQLLAAVVTPANEQERAQVHVNEYHQLPLPIFRSGDFSPLWATGPPVAQ